MKTRVKAGRKRSLSSKLWLDRQLNDPYVARAKREGFRSRAAYKLAEIDDKHHFLKAGARVVDLGAAPGGWSQIAAKRVGAADGKGRVIAIDILDMGAIPGVDFLKLDFLDPAAPDILKERLGGDRRPTTAVLSANRRPTAAVLSADRRPTAAVLSADRRPTAAVLSAKNADASHRLCDVVLSDMAANTTGHRKTDHLRIVAMVEAAADFAKDILAPGGSFLAKVIQGGTEGALLASLKRDFASVKHVKPAASRADSAELYMLATGFRGR